MSVSDSCVSDLIPSKIFIVVSLNSPCTVFINASYFLMACLFSSLYSIHQKLCQIRKYTLENGNEKARCHFLVEFPNLKESTIRNFKKAHSEIESLPKATMSLAGNRNPVTTQETTTNTLGTRHKLITFFRAV